MEVHFLSRTWPLLNGEKGRGRGHPSGSQHGPHSIAAQFFTASLYCIAAKVKINILDPLLLLVLCWGCFLWAAVFVCGRLQAPLKVGREACLFWHWVVDRVQGFHWHFLLMFGHRWIMCFIGFFMACFYKINFVNLFIYIPYLCAYRDMYLYPNFGCPRGCPNKNNILVYKYMSFYTNCKYTPISVPILKTIVKMFWCR